MLLCKVYVFSGGSQIFRNSGEVRFCRGEAISKFLVGLKGELRNSEGPLCHGCSIVWSQFLHRMLANHSMSSLRSYRCDGRVQDSSSQRGVIWAYQLCPHDTTRVKTSSNGRPVQDSSGERMESVIIPGYLVGQSFNTVQGMSPVKNWRAVFFQVRWRSG